MMRTLGYWTGACVELVATPIRENNPWLGAFVLLVLIVEAWVIVLVAGSWR